MEQIRVIKEMRALYGRPRYMVWENVPGALSSNKGEDFRAVLEETIRIVEPNAPTIPLPAKGKWPMADAWYGDGWSVAYRVLNAQFWGVPQRRRRIALVADFGGHAAPEILFVRKSVCGDIAEGGTPRKIDTRRVSCGVAESSECLTNTSNYKRCAIYRKGTRPRRVDEAQKWGRTEITNTLNTFDIGEARASELVLYENHGQDSRLKGPLSISPTVSATFGMGGNNTPLVLKTKPTETVVRRLTPLECERLQGYPDSWTDIGAWTDAKGRVRTCTDSARYKALGNSIAIPPWAWVLARLCAQIGHSATMASLFDGIGGFPLIWERLNGKGSCLWASEIEEFPIAVTQRRFEDGGQDYDEKRA